MHGQGSITPTERQAIERHRRFHAEIARRAAFVVQHEPCVRFIPNTPFGVPKIRPRPAEVIQYPLSVNWLSCMWFWELVNYVPDPPQVLTIDRIKTIVGRFYNTSKGELVSTRREQRVVKPRQIAMYLAKVLTNRSLPEIGRQFGRRDHTTVLHAVRKIKHLEEIDPNIADEIRQLKIEIAA